MCKLIGHKRYHTRKKNYETCNTVHYQKDFLEEKKNYETCNTVYYQKECVLIYETCSTVYYHKEWKKQIMKHATLYNTKKK